MGAIYWILLWLMMAAAFTTAWTFIVKGCEAMDEKHPPPGSVDEPRH